MPLYRPTVTTVWDVRIARKDSGVITRVDMFTSIS